MSWLAPAVFIRYIIGNFSNENDRNFVLTTYAHVVTHFIIFSYQEAMMTPRPILLSLVLLILVMTAG